MIRKILRKSKSLLTKRNRKYIKSVAKESLKEGKKIGSFAINEIRKNAPKAKKEISSFSKKIRKIKR